MRWIVKIVKNPFFFHFFFLNPKMHSFGASTSQSNRTADRGGSPQPRSQPAHSGRPLYSPTHPQRTPTCASWLRRLGCWSWELEQELLNLADEVDAEFDDQQYREFCKEEEERKERREKELLPQATAETEEIAKEEVAAARAKAADAETSSSITSRPSSGGTTSRPSSGGQSITSSTNSLFTAHAPTDERSSNSDGGGRRGGQQVRG
jgi:hypothetical protein